MGELRSVRADVGHLMGDNQMMLGIDCDLDVVADDARAPAAGRHRAGIGIGQRDLLVRGRQHLRLERSRRRISSFSFAIFSLSRLVLVWSASDGSCRSAVSSCPDSARRSPRSAPCAAPSWPREVLVAVVHRLELAAIDRDAGFVNRPIARHSTINRAHTLRIARHCPCGSRQSSCDRARAGPSATSPRRCAQPRAQAAGSTEPG